MRIDRAGRIVLPKPVRDRLGLKAGTNLDMRETAEGVLLTPIARRPSLVRVGRFLVHAGKLPRGVGILQALAEDRAERLRRLAGT